MANDTETLADVSALCRDIARSYRNAPSNKIEIEGLKVCDFLDELANRIDAAAKREIPQPAGNAAAIRTALREALELLNQLFDSCVLGTHSDMTADEMDKVDELYFKTKAALAASPAVDCPPSNVAALRDALTPWVSLAEWLIENAGKEALGRGIAEIVPTLRKRIDESKAALATTEGGAK